MCLYLHGQSVLFCRSRHKDHVDETHQVPSNPTLLDVIADKDTYGNVDLSYASGLERADSTKIQGRADHDPARCFFMVDIPMFVWEKDKTAVLTQKNECKVLMMSAFLGVSWQIAWHMHINTSRHSKAGSTNLRLNPAFATTQHRCIPPTTCQSAHCSCPDKIHQMLNKTQYEWIHRFCKCKYTYPYIPSHIHTFL